MFSKKVGINFNIPVKLYKSFKLLCALAGQSMTSRIIYLINEDIEKYKEENHVVL